jgi:hypothetical protein
VIVRLASIVVVCLTAAACGGASGMHVAPAPGTSGTPAPALRSALLTAPELPAMPDAFAGGPVSVASITVDPDPRGPCGVKLSQPSFRTGVVAQFQSREPAAVFQWINRLPRGTATAYIAAVADDIRPGCPAFKTATPYGHPQLNVFVGAIALPPLGDQRVAVTLRLRQLSPGARAGYGTEILIRDGDYMTGIVVTGFRPQSPSLVRAVAARAAADMSRLVRPASPA